MSRIHTSLKKVYSSRPPKISNFVPPAMRVAVWVFLGGGDGPLAFNSFQQKDA